MSNIINWNENADPIDVQLENKLVQQKQLDAMKIQANYQSDEQKKQYRFLEEDYSLYNAKLAMIPKIYKLENERQQYIKTLFYMDNLKMSEKQKLKMMLSYGVLVMNFGRIHERTEEELCVLSACSAELDIDDYTYYIGILSDEKVAKAIVQKTDNFSERVNIAYNIMDSQDELPYDFITRENEKVLINNGLDVVNNYSIAHTK